MPKGRPAISGERKQGLLQIRLTDDERSQMDSAAELTGKGTSTWARDELLKASAEQISKTQSALVAKKKPLGSPLKTQEEPTGLGSQQGTVKGSAKKKKAAKGKKKPPAV